MPHLHLPSGRRNNRADRVGFPVRSWRVYIGAGYLVADSKALAVFDDATAGTLGVLARLGACQKRFTRLWIALRGRDGAKPSMQLIVGCCPGCIAIVNPAFEGRHVPRVNRPHALPVRLVVRSVSGLGFLLGAITQHDFGFIELASLRIDLIDYKHRAVWLGCRAWLYERINMITVGTDGATHVAVMRLQCIGPGVAVLIYARTRRAFWIFN